MKVILFMASTLNGIIARENGEEDFLSDDNWDTFSELAAKIGCFIVGRKTYEAVMKWKDFNFDDIKAKKIIVSRKLKSPKENYYVARSPKDSINKAEKLGFKKILLVGGGNLNSSFMKSNLIDAIILNVNPTILGKGIRLFGEDNFEKHLKLIKIKKISSNIVQLHYKVK